MDLESKLKALGFERPSWCAPPSEKLVRSYEKRFALRLPPEYREFLLRHGGVFGSARCAFQEPTPCGDGTSIDSFYGFTVGKRRSNVVDATELIDGAPDVVAIGDNSFGAMFWLKCSGRDTGHVYMHDHEGRADWSDQTFAQMFAKPHPTIKKYLALRKRGELPKKPKGYKHVYRLAKTFTEFVENLEPDPNYQ